MNEAPATSALRREIFMTLPFVVVASVLSPPAKDHSDARRKSLLGYEADIVVDFIEDGADQRREFSGGRIARTRQIDIHNLADAARPRRHDHDAVGQEDGLVDAVRDE